MKLIYKTIKVEGENPVVIIGEGMIEQISSGECTLDEVKAACERQMKGLISRLGKEFIPGDMEWIDE